MQPSFQSCLWTQTKFPFPLLFRIILEFYNSLLLYISLQQENKAKLYSTSVEIINKMQLCNRIYYSTVHWRLSMFREAYRSSSGALTVFAAPGLHTHVVTAVVKSEWASPLRLDYGRSPHAYVNQRLQIQLELLKMSGMPLETCWAFNERWNNKFYHKVASCLLFLLSHTTMHGSENIKNLLNLFAIELKSFGPTKKIDLKGFSIYVP